MGANRPGLKIRGETRVGGGGARNDWGERLRGETSCCQRKVGRTLQGTIIKMDAPMKSRSGHN